jgi:hypothetical protein
VRLDEYLAARAVTAVDLVKVDVEGAEWPVLKGMGSLLERPDPPLLIVEASVTSAQRFDYAPLEMLEWVTSLADYRLKLLEGNRLRDCQSDDLTREDGYRDVVCIPPAWTRQLEGSL